MTDIPKTIWVELAAAQAGERVLSQNFFSLCDGERYPEIARIVFLAMAPSQR
jgi:hypothetical protein